jgi:hypothetical protein
MTKIACIGRMILTGSLAAFAGAMFDGLATAQEMVWNPRPDPNDVVFGLPCGQKIVFRRVITHDAVEEASTSLLDDRRVRLGSAEIDQAYVDYLRADFISGSFLRNDQRFYLLGKYEVTAGQYGSLNTDGSCSQGDAPDMPATSLSWYDATDFARRLTHHLLSTQRDALQRELGTNAAFARLPTETEWEFAARGGLSVSIADFQANRFPMDGDLFAYAWVNDPASAQGEPNPIGLLEPNPLGLYDVYGNASEFMADAFRLNKAGRSHGLAGGMILKGGSFQSSPSYVGSAGREESAPFTVETGEEYKARNAGLRLAVSGPALPTAADVDRLAAEWSAASQSRLPATDDPVVHLGRLKESVADLELSNNLDNLEQSVRAGFAQSEEERKRLLSALMLSVGKTISDIRNRYQSARSRRFLIDGALAESVGQEAAGRIADEVRSSEAEIQDMSYFSHELLVRIVDAFDDQTIRQQAQALAGELQQRNLDEIADSVRIGGNIAQLLSRGDGATYTREGVLSLSLSGL